MLKKTIIILIVFIILWNIYLVLASGEFSVVLYSFDYLKEVVDSIRFRFSPEPLIYRIRNDIDLIYNYSQYHQRQKLYYCKDRDKDTNCIIVYNDRYSADKIIVYENKGIELEQILYELDRMGNDTELISKYPSISKMTRDNIKSKTLLVQINYLPNTIADLREEHLGIKWKIEYKTSVGASVTVDFWTGEVFGRFYGNDGSDMKDVYLFSISK